MERNLVKQLVRWKENPGKKPLIIKGVRQCGKTFLLKGFGAAHYGDMVYCNFESNDALHAIFNGDLDAHRIISELGVMRQKPIDPEKTLVIFDEIQFCNRALTSLKYFCENAPEYHVVCAGSLLGLALSKPLSFPVGKIDFLTLYPLSFSEFLSANNEALLWEYLENLPADKKISEAFTGKLERYLKTYYITGGMPEAVASWLEFQNIEKVETIQQKILDSYELDFAKHAPANEFPKLSEIWHSIPGQLAKENTKFIFSQVKKGRRAKDLEDALEWLLGAGLAYKVAKVEKPFMPLSAYADSTFFKLYMADVGLLRKMSRLPASVILENTAAYKEFKGALTENFVLSELVTLYNTAPFYWKSGNTAEVDFIIQNEADIVPIEVKSARNDKAKSLGEYRKKYAPPLAVKTSLKNIAPAGEVQNIPLYMLWQLKKYLAK
ncbi:MAG: AAA family ATPase [Treponema sp.]|jgi:predicted AAA+ superfamily ATPase|nr:AAA family ATPase [Treponema sp.]